MILHIRVQKSQFMVITSEKGILHDGVLAGIDLIRDIKMFTSPAEESMQWVSTKSDKTDGLKILLFISKRAQHPPTHPRTHY